MNEEDAIIERLRNLGRQPLDTATTSQHLSTMAPAVRPPRWSVKLKVGTAFFAGLVLGGTGLATAGALPAPAQDVAHTTLSKVGLNVPEGHQRFNDPKVCGTDPQTGQPFRNHGEYVKAHQADPNAATSRCGKPLHAGTPANGGTSKDTEQPGTTETTDKPEAPDSAGNPGNGHGKAGKAKSGKDQGDQGNDNASPEPTDAPEPPDAPEPGGVAPHTVTPTSTSTSTSTSSTSTTSTSTTSTTVAHP